MPRIVQAAQGKRQVLPKIAIYKVGCKKRGQREYEITNGDVNREKTETGFTFIGVKATRKRGADLQRKM